MRTIPMNAAAERLLRAEGFPMLTIYMPTHRAGAAIWQDPIRWKNLLRRAEHDLAAAELEPKRIQTFLRPLTDRLDDREFWQHQAEGLALFRSDGAVDEFRLPVAVPEICVVSSRFHVKPLLLSMAGDQPYHVLALSQHGARLFRGSQTGLEELKNAGLPQGIDTVSNGHERSLQSHSAGTGTNIQHGTDMDRKAKFVRYIQELDEALSGEVPPTSPLVLAAVDYVGTLFREVSRMPGLLQETISGNPDHETADALFAKAMPIAQRHFAGRREAAEQRFRQSLRTGRALERMEEAIVAARQGRVETLFVPTGVQVWGRISGDGEPVLSERQGPEDQDLLNEALIDTWKAGGEVYAVPATQMPEGRVVAGVARF